MTADRVVPQTVLFAVFSCSVFVADQLHNLSPETSRQYTNGTNETNGSSTSRVEHYDNTSSTTYQSDELRQDDVTINWTMLSGNDVTTASLNMTSRAPDAAVQQPADTARTVTYHRRLRVPDPGERWKQASHRVGVARQQRATRDLYQTRSAIVAISSVFFTLTVVSTVALGIFCRKRNTVFVLQKCEQRNYAVAADDDEEEDWSTDCDSTTSQTVATLSELGHHSSQRHRRDLAAAPTTPDLSLFCTSQTGKRNRTGSGSRRRDKVSRRAMSEVRSSRRAATTTFSTTLPVECTDDDTDDDVNHRVTRDVMSVGLLLRCDVTGTSGLYDGDASRCQRSTSLEADVCRFALTRDAASSQPLMTRNDSSDVTQLEELDGYQLTGNGTESRPCHETNTGDFGDRPTGNVIEQSTFEPSTCDGVANYCHDSTQQEEPTT